MKDFNDLKRELQRIDGKGYKSYKDLQGEKYDFKTYILAVDHVQGDPFAAPSRIRVIINSKISNFPKELINKKCKRIAASDFLIRTFYKNINVYSKRVFGSGKSGLISISRCDEEILDRTAVIMDDEKIEARFEVGFPARGRSVLAKELEKILYDFLPQIVKSSLIYDNINKKRLLERVKLAEDQQYIRDKLSSNNLVAFVANGSILPRESGVSTKRLEDAIKFTSPKSLEVTLEIPNRGKIIGMGIPKGITIIVGGGYHGKSTLLRALELGVYNHIEGDGREYVITDDTAVKVRAEDGRVINNEDISLFINNLPNGKDTKRFTSENASGSTSQASNIIEAIEGQSKLLLIDEDTSATNFMVRDEIMQRLVAKDKEPITPFIEMVRPLYEQKDISTIIVVGSSGDYFSVADNVILLDSYNVFDVTEKAKELSKPMTTNKDINIDINFNRIVKKGSIEKGPKGVKIKTLGVDGVSINKEDIILRSVEQLVDREQVNFIGEAMRWAEDNVVDGHKNLEEIAIEILKYVEKEGIIKISQSKGGVGNLAMARKHETMAAFNRYRKLKI